ncbi:MAG: DUF2254 domain-containing protein [Spirochaetia bacterium]
MARFISFQRIKFILKQFREILWLRPLVLSLAMVGLAFVVKLTDGTGLDRIVPEINRESIETLLTIMASSMLVIATLAVGAMVSAYASASSTATPRTFRLVIADDLTQNALSTFLGAFIFSIVGLTSVKNDFYGKTGVFVVFALTVLVFGTVILTFVRWVDRIARLGRLGMTIDMVEKAAARSLQRRGEALYLHGVPVKTTRLTGKPVFACSAGYIQQVDVASLQNWAEKAGGRVVVKALSGDFVAPGDVLAYARAEADGESEVDYGPVAQSFVVRNERQFDDDPRFGLVVLSEIAGRALSPAVNDPGTAVDILGALVRLFILWNECGPAAAKAGPKYDLVEVPAISERDMFDDAFTAIARDGAGTVEVAVRLQEALRILAQIGNVPMRKAALLHAGTAFKRSEKAMTLEEDLAAVREAAGPAENPEEDIQGGEVQ